MQKKYAKLTQEEIITLQEGGTATEPTQEVGMLLLPTLRGETIRGRGDGILDKLNVASLGATIVTEVENKTNIIENTVNGSSSPAGSDSTYIGGGYVTEDGGGILPFKVGKGDNTRIDSVKITPEQVKKFTGH